MEDQTLAAIDLIGDTETGLLPYELPQQSPEFNDMKWKALHFVSKNSNPFLSTVDRQQDTRYP